MTILEKNTKTTISFEFNGKKYRYERIVYSDGTIHESIFNHGEVSGTHDRLVFVINHGEAEGKYDSINSFEKIKTELRNLS